MKENNEWFYKLHKYLCQSLQEEEGVRPKIAQQGEGVRPTFYPIPST